MIRDIKSSYNGNDFTIKAVRETKFSDYEFLLPYRYKIIYGGEYSCMDICFISPDLNSDLFGLITDISIINMSPKAIPNEYSLWPNDQNDDIDYLKFIVSNCDMIKFKLSDDGKIQDCFIYYTIKSEADQFAQWIYLNDPDDTSSNLMSKYYL